MNPQDFTPPSPEEELDMLIEGVRPLFEAPVSEVAADVSAQLPGIDVSSFTLASREVLAQDDACPSGHLHRDVSLVETFKAAAEGAEAPAVPTLDEALADFKAKVSAPTGEQDTLFERNPQAGVAVAEDGQSFQRVLSLSDAYDTAANVEEAMKARAEAIIAQFFGGPAPGGNNGPKPFN